MIPLLVCVFVEPITSVSNRILLAEGLLNLEG